MPISRYNFKACHRGGGEPEFITTTELWDAYKSKCTCVSELQPFIPTLKSSGRESNTHRWVYRTLYICLATAAVRLTVLTQCSRTRTLALKISPWASNFTPITPVFFARSMTRHLHYFYTSRFYAGFLLPFLYTSFTKDVSTDILYEKYVFAAFYSVLSCKNPPC